VTVAERYWWLAPLLSAIALGFILWFNSGRQKVREWRMKRPFNAYMTRHADDPGERLELRLPSHSQVTIQIRMRPRLNYKQSELIFGFLGDLDKRPLPDHVSQSFIKREMNKRSPDTSSSHYIDHTNHYHIRDDVNRTKYNTYVKEFVVNTRDVGEYPVLLLVATDCGEGKPYGELLVIVD
jgi:hypothetical protein